LNADVQDSDCLMRINYKQETAMKNHIRIFFTSVFFLLGSVIAYTPGVNAHCQIPCGIYNDHARVMSMLEDTVTIEKSIKMIQELSSSKDAQSQNQLVRWIMNKEAHAQKIISTVCDYFLTQRIKPGGKDYSERLENHHKVIVDAMEAKQNTGMEFVKTLRKDIEALLPYYPEH